MIKAGASDAASVNAVQEFSPRSVFDVKEKVCVDMSALIEGLDMEYVLQCMTLYHGELL